jgi:uncharacterized protein with PhoU and TrkA domain
LIEQGEQVHPILNIALGEADEVVVRMPVAAGSTADETALAELQLSTDPGFHVLGVRRGGRYIYRPRGSVRLQADDEIIATGPDEGRPILAQLLGWHLVERDDDTGSFDLEALREKVPVRAWDPDHR